MDKFTEIEAHRAHLARRIDMHLAKVSKLWQQLRSLDREATDLRFRSALSAFNLPGGYKLSKPQPLAARFDKLK